MRLLFGVLSLLVCSVDPTFADDEMTRQSERIEEYRAVISDIADEGSEVHELPGEILAVIELWIDSR
jgi:hypothetical protein